MSLLVVNSKNGKIEQKSMISILSMPQGWHHWLKWHTFGMDSSEWINRILKGHLEICNGRKLRRTRYLGNLILLMKKESIHCLQLLFSGILEERKRQGTFWRVAF